MNGARGYAAALLAAFAGVLAATVSGCGPRTTFDRFDAICFSRPSVSARVAASNATVTADLERAIPYYVRFGGLFREVRIGCDDADALTVRVELTVLEYTPARGPLGAVLGGRGRGGARIRYIFRDGAGETLWEEDIRSVARSGPGVFTDIPPPLGGVDPAVEGAAAALHWWLRRSKSPPGVPEGGARAKQ